MWPGRVLNPGPLTYESGALPTALRGPASLDEIVQMRGHNICFPAELTKIIPNYHQYSLIALKR